MFLFLEGHASLRSIAWKYVILNFIKHFFSILFSLHFVDPSTYYAVFVIFELFSRTAVFCLYGVYFSCFCYFPGRFSVILRPNH